MTSVPRLPSAVEGARTLSTMLADIPELVDRFVPVYGRLWSSDVAPLALKEVMRARRALRRCNL